MNRQVPVSGVTLRAWRVLERSPSADWVDWAIRELEHGRDGPNLRILAGLHEPFDYLETIRFVDGALLEVGLAVPSRDEAIAAYEQELVTALLETPALMSELLSQLASLCIDTGYRRSLMPFYLLHFAHRDLQSGHDQHYWDGADASNIDEIVQTEAHTWLAERSRAA